RREMSTLWAAGRLAGILPGALRLARLIARERIDLVHTNTSVPVAGALAARLMGRPHLWHVREVLDRPRPIAPLLCALIPRLADRVVCISAAVRAPFGDLPPALARRLVVIPDGIDVDQFPPPAARRAPHPDAPLVGMVARVTPFKGHALFLTGAAQVAATAPGARFVVAGGCPPAYADLRATLMAQAAGPALGGRVRFLGQLARPAVRALLAELTVFVHPAVQPEPLGLVVLEAMAAGCAVVATAHGGPLEIIQDGVDGLLVPPTAAALAGAITRLLADPPLRARLGAAAHARVATTYALATQMERIAVLYDSLVAERR
ncbi:MAG TPA: glycosyltransferase family 4 protein, partial [Chloroflexia bacterium]|nr:glycosyltransferase family 4 protein [Chloroflexia bacterium]